VSFRLLFSRALGGALFAALLVACDTPGAGASTGQGQASPVQTRARTTQTAPAPGRDRTSGLAFVAVRDLPPEGQRTLRLIRAGGPFPYRKDGSTFGNREGLLPRRPRGGYREYTVPTPGEGDRGARRIVCAALTPPDRECYYTADHYSTFRRVRP